MAFISKKKIPFKINLQLRKYLAKYGREAKMSIQYVDLLRFESSISLYDRFGADTLWVTVFFPHNEIEHIYESLKKIYADLKTDGDEKTKSRLAVATSARSFPADIAFSTLRRASISRLPW